MIMNAINTAISFLNQSIDVSTAYVKNNAFPITILLAVVYYFRTRYPKSRDHGYVLSSSSSSSSVKGGLMSLSSQNNKNDSSSSNSIADRQEEIKIVRQRQQDLANERATEAAKIRKVKEAEERERKKNIARKKHDNGGTRLGTTSISNTTKPQTSTSTSSSYSPTRPSPNA